jgi:hypothetical protein
MACNPAILVEANMEDTKSICNKPVDGQQGTRILALPVEDSGARIQ